MGKAGTPRVHGALKTDGVCTADRGQSHRGQNQRTARQAGKEAAGAAGIVLPAAEGGQEPGTGERLDRRVQRVCHWDLYKGQCQWVGAETALRKTKEKLRQMKTLPKDPATKEERHR